MNCFKIHNRETEDSVFQHETLKCSKRIFSSRMHENILLLIQSYAQTQLSIN